VLLVSGLLIALGLGARQLVRSGGRASWVQALPILGPLIREFRHTQLYRTTGMLVQGGIPLPKALSLCDMLLSHDDRSRLLRALELIREGQTLSDALQDTGIADPVSTGMLSVAERSGDLAAILERIAHFKESRLQRSVDWASRLVEPALMVVIGLVIGAIVVLMYLPIFDLASSLQ
jgi:general secretion pathway protein F